MIFDTDILIWFLRGNEKAAHVIENEDLRKISTITYLELFQGVKNKQESKQIRHFVSDYSFEVIPLSENIGHRAIIYMEQYGLKVDICLSDVLIAASTVETNEILYTGNTKHYRIIPDLEIKQFRV
ncbi:MAG: type II toxin-antitoxin system VapC family toxin [Candidatus Scalindua sp. AMX11]|nr:MAG: type II toxin-antitoxin system VapC family toxin [Candidatus Scalindua sp.]NOG82807.1 type II toxin-antitoxin system VapC family toxin [Planctomycetota bacterium]RZV69035.1 MAG: type II toxin-antitoxin system VapC family toxin [Candidatus Scalindua sp. SCAELEC01]TDE63866.1 MAG: type II toxin-antitoxin system VapC family toxin [Candidatus Scalindua sp. AMX11]GJQ60420.1 MAG: ribonuclease VapC [Candidatus Scalindua sp.]